MMRTINTPLWCACIAAAMLPAAAAAQAPRSDQSPDQPETAEARPQTELTPAEATAELSRIRGWLRAGAVPAPGELGPDAANDKIRFAAVTLRVGGRVIGRGEHARSPGDALEGDPVAEAARAAVDSGRDRVTRGQTGLLAESAWSRAEPDVRIALELSGSAIPLDDQDQRLAEAARRSGLAGLVVRPGLEGVAARRGELIAWRSLSWLRSRDQAPGAALASLAGRLSGDPSLGLEPLPALAGRGFVFLRVPVLELAEIGPARTPVFLHRGGEVVESGSIDSAALREAGAALVDHLAARAWPGVEPLGLRGAYDARAGAYRTVVASPLEQGLAIAALDRWARVTGGERAATLADELRRELAEVDDRERAPWSDPPSAAAAVLAGVGGDARRRCLETLSAAFDGESFGNGDLPPAARGLVAHALVRAAALGESDPETAASAVRAVYRETSPETLITQMPFLAMASIELAELAEAAERAEPAGPAGRGGEPIAAAAALRDLRGVVTRHLLGPSDVDRADRDLLGATVFTRGPALLPSWQSARSSALLAVMLGEPSLTPRADREALAQRIVNHLRSVRFLVQLQALRRGVHAYPDAGMARGGVRAAVWSDTMPLLASALTLWTYAETLDGLARVRDAMGGAPGGGDDGR